jgi:hypothetical protein
MMRGFICWMRTSTRSWQVGAGEISVRSSEYVDWVQPTEVIEWDNRRRAKRKAVLAQYFGGDDEDGGGQRRRRQLVPVLRSRWGRDRSWFSWW